MINQNTHSTQIRPDTSSITGITVTSNNASNPGTGWRLMCAVCNFKLYYKLYDVTLTRVRYKLENQCWKSLDLGSR